MPGELTTPTHRLYRIGRGPNPLALPPWDLVGAGRFDDSRTSPRFRVLYAGERQACFFECLAQFRADISGVGPEGITAAWLESRRIAAFRMLDPAESGRWLDLTSPSTYAEFRRTFNRELKAAGLVDFDVSAATSERRILTQAIGGWAYERGYQGIRYVTRHAPHLYCWAIFAGDEYEIVESPAPIAPDDHDFQAVVRQWGLRLPSRSSLT